MMKKIAYLLSFLLLFMCFFASAVYAENKKDISARFSAALSGLSVADYEQFVDCSQGKMKLCDDKIMVCECTQDAYFGKMKPGRTYYIYYEFDLTECEKPSELNDSTTSLTCEEGAKIVWYHYVDTAEKTQNLYVCEKITIQGNFIERSLGKLADFFRKVSAWSPY